MLAFLANEKDSLIWIKKDDCSLIFIDKNQLLSKNRKVDKKNRATTIYNLAISWENYF